jgi:hypothetical protein
MADAGLFVGFGAPVRGREGVGLTVFNDAIQWWESQQASGSIESFEVVLLQPHGGDLGGFFLVRGTQDQIDAARGSEEFLRLHTRAGLVTEGLGIVPVWIGDGLGPQIGRYQEAIVELV